MVAAPKVRRILRPISFERRFSRKGMGLFFEPDTRQHDWMRPRVNILTALMRMLRRGECIELAEISLRLSITQEDARALAATAGLVMPARHDGEKITWRGEMPRFSQTSLKKLSTCDPNLQKLFHRVVQTIDCTILTGHRNEAEQERLYQLGRTRLHWPHSKHNSNPSRAVDAAPYPIDWNVRDPKVLKRYYYFAGIVMGMARAMGIPLRWGGDWDMDNDLSDQRFYDLVHFELTNTPPGKHKEEET